VQRDKRGQTTHLAPTAPALESTRQNSAAPTVPHGQHMSHNSKSGAAHKRQSTTPQTKRGGGGGGAVLHSRWVFIALLQVLVAVTWVVLSFTLASGREAKSKSHRRSRGSTKEQQQRKEVRRQPTHVPGPSRCILHPAATYAVELVGHNGLHEGKRVFRAVKQDLGQHTAPSHRRGYDGVRVEHSRQHANPHVHRQMRHSPRQTSAVIHSMRVLKLVLLRYSAAPSGNVELSEAMVVRRNDSGV